MLKLELKEVYRQSDPTFINLLNIVRTGELSKVELEHLNALYTPNWAKENATIITTHNRYASDLNRERLNSLPGLTHTFTAEIDGTFGEDHYPVDYSLQLKSGCKVMVIKNDHSGHIPIFNGKTGSVLAISNEAITVQFEDDTTIVLEKEIWPQLVFTYDEEKKIVKEHITGTFKQFPLKLAWALTVHKSQVNLQPTP